VSSLILVICMWLKSLMLRVDVDLLVSARLTRNKSSACEKWEKWGFRSFAECIAIDIVAVLCCNVAALSVARPLLNHWVFSCTVKHCSSFYYSMCHSDTVVQVLLFMDESGFGMRMCAEIFEFLNRVELCCGHCADVQNWNSCIFCGFPQNQHLFIWFTFEKLVLF
jgi:hypothetical protein